MCPLLLVNADALACADRLADAKHTRRVKHTCTPFHSHTHPLIPPCRPFPWHQRHPCRDSSRLDAGAGRGTRQRPRHVTPRGERRDDDAWGRKCAFPCRAAQGRPHRWADYGADHSRHAGVPAQLWTLPRHLGIQLWMEQLCAIVAVLHACTDAWLPLRSIAYLCILHHYRCQLDECI